MKSRDLKNYKIQFITHYTEHYDYFESAQMALQGGIRWIQVRIKHQPLSVVKEESIRIQQLCKQYDALFFIDDYVELAMELKADGVHLGQNDMPVKEARMLSNNQLLIGGTANTFEQIESLYQQKADYIGLGPYRFTKTKENLSAVLGSKGVEEIIAKCRRKGIDIPIHIIGGIRKADVLPILKAGAHGVAVSSAILQANLPIEEAAAFVSAVKKKDK